MRKQLCHEYEQTAHLFGLLGIDAGCWPLRGGYEGRLVCRRSPALCARSQAARQQQLGNLSADEAEGQHHSLASMMVLPA